jgi:hypothetical protein
MAQRDGTGPPRQGIGRRQGMRRNSGRGMGRGGGRGRMGGNRPGAGPGGDCICPSCGKRVTHQQGIPCYSMDCPQCGTNMRRE